MSAGRGRLAGRTRQPPEDWTSARELAVALVREEPARVTFAPPPPLC